MTLHLYFGRKFLKMFVGVAMIFVLLLALIDLIEQLRQFSDAGIGFGRIIELVLLNVAGSVYTILPLIMILSTVALFLGLARTSELVVVRASGRSALHTLLAPVAAALLVGAVALSVLNPLVAATSKRYSDLSERYQSGDDSILSLSPEGLWLRQGDADGQTVIRAARSNAEATELFDVTFLAYAAGGGPLRRIVAERATLTEGAWDLENVKLWPLADAANPEGGAERFETYSLPSTLTQDRIRDSFGLPSAIPIWDLPRYIEQLEGAGFSARRHAVWFQTELAKPLFLVAMVLVASAFTMRHARFGRTGVAVLAAILLGFTLYYIRNVAQILGENGQIPIMLAAWAPPTASVLLALGLLLHMEDG